MRFALKMFLYGVLFAMPCPTASAQEATLDTPVARTSEAKLKISRFEFNAGSGVSIVVAVQDSDGVDIRVFGLGIPSEAGAPCTLATTGNGLANAMNNPRASETGAAGRIQFFRILGYLFDRGCLLNVSLVP